MDLMEVRRRVMLSMANGNTNIHYGKFTVDTPIANDYYIPHGFNVAPSFFMILNDSEDTNNYRRFVIRTQNNNFGIYGINATVGGKNDLSTLPQAYAYVNDTDIILHPTSTPWGTGDYVWVAIK